MTSATFTPATLPTSRAVRPVGRDTAAVGSAGRAAASVPTAVAPSAPPRPAAEAHGTAATDGRGGAAHRVGGALRAVRVFAAAAFSVVVLGDYADGV